MGGLAEAEDEECEGRGVEERGDPSKAWPERPVSGRARRASARAASPIGRLTAKSHGQDATSRISEAAVGPRAKPTPTTKALRPIPRPSWWGGVTKRISATLTAIRALAPTPWSTRAATRAGSDQASAQTSEATVNSARPTR